MTSAALRTLIAADARLLWRDPLLIWMTAVPLGMALLIKLVVRAAVEAFPAAAPVLPQYHALIMGGYLMTAPGMIGFVIGFLLLDERDAGTLKALRITPLRFRNYLVYRLVGPLLIGTIATLLGYPLAGLAPIPLLTLVPIAAAGAIAAPLIAFALGAFAANKVAGFAVVKILNAVNLLPIAAFFVPVPLQYAAGILPTYWPMRALWSVAAGESAWPFLAIGSVVGLLAVLLAAQLFEQRSLRTGN
jgi:hypothetical protein